MKGLDVDLGGLWASVWGVIWIALPDGGRSSLRVLSTIP